MVKGATDEGITDIIAERAYARHLIGPLFHGEVFVRIGRRHGCPAFTVGEDGRINLVECGTDLTHGLLVMDAHEVKTETVDVVLACPVTNGLYHELAVHLMVGSGLVAATGTVGIGTILVEAVEILRYNTTKGAAHNIVGMVINDIHDNADTGFMQGLNHLFCFTNTASWVSRVGGITSFGGIVVYGIIAPVVAVLSQVCLVDGSVVKHRQDLEMGDTEFLQIIERRFFGEAEELAFVLYAGIGRHGEVTEMGLIDDDIGHVRHRRTYILCPAFRVGGCEIDDRGALTVDRDRFGKDTRCFRSPFAVLERTNGVVLTGKVAFDRSRPEIVGAFGERNGLKLSGVRSVIEMDLHLFGHIGPECKLVF